MGKGGWVLLCTLSACAEAPQTHRGSPVHASTSQHHNCKPEAPIALSANAVPGDKGEYLVTATAALEASADDVVLTIHARTGAAINGTPLSLTPHADKGQTVSMQRRVFAAAAGGDVVISVTATIEGIRPTRLIGLRLGPPAPALIPNETVITMPSGEVVAEVRP